MEQENNGVIEDKPDRKWMTSLAVVCFGIIAYGYFYSENQSANFGYLLGFNLFYVLIIWGIFQALVGRKHGRNKGGLSFLAIYGSLIACSLIGYSQQKSAAIQVVKEIQSDYSSIIKSSTSPEGLPQRIEGRLDTTPKTKGQAGELERFMKAYMNRLVSQRNDYALEIDAIGWGNILDPERVKKDRNLIESKVIVKQAKDIVEKYRARTYALIENTRKDVNNLNVNENIKIATLRGFDKGVRESTNSINAMWDLEANIISEVEKIFDLLYEKRGAWEVHNSQILFTSDRDLIEFNSHITAISNAVSKQEFIQKQSIDVVNNNLNSALDKAKK